jgi:DNA-binding MurR/RpiR family transcriptional regulator
MLLVHEDLTTDDSAANAVQKAMTAGMRSLEDTVRILEMTVLESAIQAICAAHRVELFASGNSIPLAMDTRFSADQDWVVLSLFDRPYGARNVCQPDHAEDVAIGISHTGSSKDTVYALELARQRGARTVCITNHSDSPLTRHGDFCLFTSTRVQPLSRRRWHPTWPHWR